MFRGKEKYLILQKKKAYATSTYSDKKTLEFTIELAANIHTNDNSMCIVLPIQIKKSTDKSPNVNVITVNNFFVIEQKKLMQGVIQTTSEFYQQIIQSKFINMHPSN